MRVETRLSRNICIPSLTGPSKWSGVRRTIFWEKDGITIVIAAIKQIKNLCIINIYILNDKNSNTAVTLPNK